MMRQTICLLILLTIRITPCAAGGDDKSNGAPATWQDEAAKQGLSDAEIASLQKNDILLTSRTYRQIYSAYLHPEMSVFVTSDSLLNAYHVLLEESIVQFEVRQVSRLSDVLRMMLTDLSALQLEIKDQPKLNAAAQRRSRLVLGTALKLLDNKFVFDDPELDEILTAESQRIESAEAVYLPAWLDAPGSPLNAIHYSRFRPRSFYTRSAQLERYFRAVAWLQAIPFRIERDEELLSMLMLGHTLRSRSRQQPQQTGFGDANRDWDEVLKAEEDERRWRETFQHLHRFFGVPDLPDVCEAAFQVRWLTPSAEDETDEDETDNAAHEDEADGAGATDEDVETDPERKVLFLRDLRECREALLEEFHRDGKEPQINDQDRLNPENPKQIDEVQFRVMSASRTPDAMLFQQTTDPQRFPNRRFPAGLEVAVALGSPAARTFLNDPEKERLLQVIDSRIETFKSEDLYGAWLNTLRSLLDEPEHDAPQFMHSEAWQRKNCNTVLASWTQLRHTAALAAKINGGAGGGRIPPPGFVEPDPEFFSRLANLAEETLETLYAADDTRSVSPDYRQLLPALKAKIGLANGVADAAAMERKLKEHWEVENILRSLSYEVNRLVVNQSASEVPYNIQWNQIIDQELSSAKIEEMSNLAKISSDFRSLIDQYEERKVDRGQLAPSLIEDLRLLADNHPEKSLPSADRWIQVSERLLPRIVESLRRLADGIDDYKSMVALMESRWGYESRGHDGPVTKLIHRNTQSAADNQVPYSELWDRIVEQLIKKIETGESEHDADLTAIVDPEISDLSEIWVDFISTCRRLEMIAHKQLRGADLNKGERWFVSRYGEKLAHLMLRHEGLERDDAPWAAAVYTNHLLRLTMHATISRPQALYVLYPWGETKVLCRGVVLPYREVVSSQPLTDEEWREQLDSEIPPPLPEWLQPILSPAPHNP